MTASSFPHAHLSWLLHLLLMLNYLSVEKEDCSHLGFPYGINYDRLDMISTLISVILVCSCVCVYVSVSVLVNVCVCV